MVRVDTAALRAAAKQLRDEAADAVGEAGRATRSTEDRTLVGFAFDRYGSHDGYKAVSQAWRGELSGIAEALRQLADALDTAADNYDRSDENASARFGPGGPR
ncbi:WXG100 family type VII secretion target [Plantactinospora sp. WMMB334]|uniref:WXG100 family type VII secretion target n=1 Tax=Plantactinospora sp. WMMB334 TaxID=3404119 RepID=UPI003B93713B